MGRDTKSELKKALAHNSRLTADVYAKELRIEELEGECMRLAATANLAGYTPGALTAHQRIAQAEIVKNKRQSVRIKELEALLKMDGWQPIETAPKDTEVLLWIQGWVGHMNVGHIERDDNEEFWVGVLGEKICPAPSHWMPLPAPPEQEEA